MNDRSFTATLRRMTRKPEPLNREQSTELRRDAIVAAALHCFVESGFHQASMRDIASKAGVSVGNLYNHFATKDALIAEIAALELQELAPLLESLEAAAPLEGLLQFAQRYAQVCMQPDNVMLTSEVIAEAARNPELAARFAVNHAQLVNAIGLALERGIQNGTLDPALPVRTTAALMLDAIEGHALRSVLFAPKKAALRHAMEGLTILLRKLLAL